MGGAESADQKPPKAWEVGAWVGLFCDPYADGVLGVGEVAACVGTLAELLSSATPQLTLWDDQGKQHLADLRAVLGKINKLATFAAKSLKDPDALCMLIESWVEELRGLPIGGYTLVPCGWKDGLGADNCCILIVEKIERPTAPTAGTDAAGAEVSAGGEGATPPAAPVGPFVRVVFINTAEGTDTYHPASLNAAPASKVRRKTGILLGELPMDKVADPAFLAMLLTQRRDHETHKVELTYDALLPWLVDQPTLVKPLAACVGDDASDWRTPSRSKTSGWKSLMEASRYMLRRKGVTTEALKQLSLQMRSALLAKAVKELQLMADPGAARSPAALAKCLADLPLVDGKGSTLNGSTALAGKQAVGLYFSAHWCPPCRGFTPRLCETYKKLRDKGEMGFEVIFISRDNDQPAFNEYFGEMPWLAIPYGNPAIEELVDKFEVRGIPSLAIVSPEGELLNLDGRSAVQGDPVGANFPWKAAAAAPGAAADAPPESITPSDRVLLSLGARQLARAALKEQSSGRLQDGELAQIEEQIAECDRLAVQLEKGADVGLPPPLTPQLSALAKLLGDFELLCGTGEDIYRGQRVTPPPPPLANMLDLPLRAEIDCFVAILDALRRCTGITDNLLRRARDTGGGANATSASRLAIQGQVISLIQCLFTEVLPLPLPPGAAATGACPWTVHPVTNKQQLDGMQFIYKLMHRLAEMWQDIEEPTRVSECVRATAGACAFAMFDCVLRQVATDKPMELSVLLTEGDGFALSTGVGRMRGLDFEKASEKLELMSPPLVHARADALAYFGGVKAVTGEAIFEMPIVLGGEAGLVVQLEKYGPTCVFLLSLMERYGYPIIPEGNRPQTEMDSIMMWFGSHPEQETAHSQLAKEHPEWMLLRDAATIYKFLYSMLPLAKENMTVRKEIQDFRGHLPLSFSPGTGKTGGRMESLGKVMWQTQTVFGSHKQTANIVGYCFYNRKITWGDGATLKSPANVGSLVDRDKPTEEDILHCSGSQLKKARFDGTLSTEEAESLLTCMVAPYVRIPLVAHFFADLTKEPTAGDAFRCGNRASFLFNDRLQALFQASILEQGTWVPEASKGMVVRVPMRRTARQQEEYRQLLDKDARRTAEAKSLGSPFGLLLNELTCSPDGTLRPLIEILRYTQEVAHCSLHSTSATFTLFILSVGVVVELFGLEAKQELEAAGVDVSPLLGELGELLRGPVLGILDKWIDEASKEVSTDGKRVGNLPTLAVLHAYRAMLFAPRIAGGSIEPQTASSFVGSLAYVRGHHCYGQQLRNSELTAEEHAQPELVEKKLLDQLSKFLQSQGFEASTMEQGYLKKFITGAPVWFVHEGVCVKVPLAGMSERSQGFMAPPAEVPEMLISDVLTLVRRPIVMWMEALEQEELGKVLSDVVCTALGSSHSVPTIGWEKTAGHPGLYCIPGAGVICDVQGAEILYQSEELRPVPDSMSSFSDFEYVFGREALQCAFRFTHEHRRWVDIIGEEHELLEWDAPCIDAQGIGAPSPLPGIVFQDPSSVGPPTTEVLDALCGLKVTDHEGNVSPALEALGGVAVIGIYFSAHWCPPCRGFTPKFGSTYKALEESQPGQFGAIFVSSDRGEEEFKNYFASMPWKYAVPYADGEARQKLGQLFGVQGIPSLCFVTPTGHVVSMNGREKVSEDPTGQKFPWGSLEPKPVPEGPKEDAITFNGVRYNRPFVWYHPGKVFPAPPPDPEPSEAWAVEILQPVLEALFPSCPPDKRMTYVLYMPEATLAEEADELVLIGMSDEDKDFATWKEIRVHKLWKVVHCYNLISHGRRMFRMLVWSSHGARCLQTLPPMHLKPGCCPIPPVILDASGDWKLKRLPDPSLVIVRQNHDIGGRETFLPPRLLAGVVPGAFLDAYAFWQTEDLTIRGYPNNPKDEWFPYALEITLIPGAGAQIIRCDPSNLSGLIEMAGPPDLARVVSSRNSPTNLRRERSAGSPPQMRREISGRSSAGSDTEAAAPASQPVLSRNKSVTLRLAPLLDMGFSEEQARNALDAARGPDGRENYDLAVSLLSDGDFPMPTLEPVSEEAAGPPPGVTVPPILSREKSAFGGVAGESKMRSEPRKQDASKNELVLLDLFRSPAGSFLHYLAKAFARIEDLGHVLVWGGALDPATNANKIARIELPRLKLRFQVAKMGDGTVRVCSTDHDGWFVANIDLESPDGAASQSPRTKLLVQLLHGIPHCLLLENATKELQLLVPAWELRRPKEKGAPFGTHLIFNRGSDAWTEIFSNTRCFLYPVHATRAFLMPKSLDALLYLVLLRFYGRRYDAAHKWATSIAVDVPFSATELWVYKQFKHVKDGHPDANALRLRLTIAVRFSPDAESMDLWESHLEFDSYLAKVPHVSAGCALTPLEELQGIKMLKEMTPNLKIRKKMLDAYNAGSAALEIGGPMPQVGGEPWQKMVTVSKELFEQSEWLKRFKFKIPTEEGGLGLRDGEALMPIFESMLMDDDEVGNTRQLGFVFLYALAIGQLPIEVVGKQCGTTMGQILTRSLQLKLAHWGKRAGSSEVEAKLSKQCAVLSMIFDHPTAGWPRLPLPGSDVPAPGKYTFHIEEISGAVKALAEGVNVDAFIGLPEEEGEEDEEEAKKTRGQMAMWNWHVDLKDVVRKLFEARMVDVYRTGRREMFKTKSAEIEAWACTPQVVDLASPSAAINIAPCLPPFKPSDMSCEKYLVAPFKRPAAPDGIPFKLPDGVDLTLTSGSVSEFAGMPLASAAGDTIIEVTPAPGPEIDAKLSFPLAKHPAAASAIAVDMLARLEKDLCVYKKDQRDKRDVRLRTMEPEDLKAICAGETANIDASIQALDFLLGSLAQAYESGMQYIENAVSMAVAWASYISAGSDTGDGLARCQFRLKQRSGLVLALSYEALIATSLSTAAFDDLSRFNPFLQDGRELMPLIAATELHANRIAQTARTLTAIRSLKQQLAVIKQNGKANAAQSVKMSHSIVAVATQLGARRYCLELSADGTSGELDPRLLVFEFLSSFLLRERQVQMVRDLKGRALQGMSSCQQMIMGAGKTTVVGPLLVLCLADGSTAVLQTMPSALLEMTRNVLREVFAYPLAKQVFTLTFDRTQDKVGPVLAIIEKLELAMKHRGVVVAAPESIKSLTLKMIELCHSLDQHGTVSRQEALNAGSGRAAKEQFDALNEMMERVELADACSKVLSLWKQGVVIMDEVDVLLHPLRSELNFPIGEKVPVDLSGERWELPIHLLSLIFIDELELALSTESEVEKAAWKEAETKAGESRADIAKAFRVALTKGVGTFSFMTLPHLVLMDGKFYQEELASIAARFCLLWIHRLSPDNIPALAANPLLLGYLTGKSDLASDIVEKLRPETMKMLNLAADWVLSFLPHVLSRVNRVSYGLLSEHDKQPASAPESRRLMAVPFLAKDVPSRNSEFAHPDIVIGFTILAFRHEGLRTEDMHRIVKQLKGDFARQIGPRSGRPANILFDEWVGEGREAWSRAPGGTPPSCLNLELFQPEEGVQMGNLHRLLTKRPKVVHHYLTRMVFPDTMLFHRLKVSACGHELGSDMIFARRIGFSGTPSNLLPIDLQPCTYEPGSDGKIIEVLTDPSVVSTTDVPTGWDAKSLLGQVATAEPAFHALIDTGALVTGLESAEVADILLQELPAWFEGVVYLDKSDRQMVLLRSSGRSAPLQQCGLPLDKRFTFYDQIHTTGMDIKQAPNARAALTIGKDMVFRDYAQGAWRMRGIGIGQTISLMIIPEVQKRIQQDLEAVPGLFVEGGWASNVPAWLLVNSMRSEGLQEVQLNLQELHNVYRKRALSVLQDDAAAFAGAELPEERCSRFTAETERAKKLRAAIQVFREKISNEIDSVVPKPKTLRQVFDENVVEYTALGAKELLGVDSADESRLEQVRARTAAGSSEETKAVRGGMEATREQQQEQEQQQQQMKEREQEEEQMTQFCRDEEGPLPWFVETLAHSPSNGMETALIEAREAGKSFPFSSLMTGDAFYPMALFHATENQPQMPFPRNLLLSTNYFRPRWAGMGDRRLKNISLVVEWVLGEGPEQKRFLVVPSLAEAETIRRLIHNGEYGVYDKEEGITLEKKSLKVALAVRTLGGHKLDSTKTFSEDSGGSEQLRAGLQCLRFFHGDMFFSDEELRMIMTSLSAATPEQRKDFFEECIRRRRRERREWTDTPIARVFVPEEEWAILRPRALVEQVTGNVLATLSFVDKKTKEKEKLEEVALAFISSGDDEKADEQSTKIGEIVREIAPYPKDIRAIFEMFDIDKDDMLNRTEMTSFLKGFDVHPMAMDVQGILSYLGTDGTSLSWSAFENAFGPKPGAAEDMDVDMCGPWVCRRCQLPNLYESITCVYCQQEPRPDLATVMPDLGGPGRGQWECGTCHFYNVDEDAFCAICSMAKGSVATGDFE